MKKTFLFLAALAMSVSLSAEKITTLAGITSGNKYYIGATTSSTDYYFYVDGSSKTASIKGVAKEDVADAVALTFTAVTDGWTIQFESGLYLGLKNAKDNGAVQVMEAPVVWTIDEDTDKGLLKLHPNDYYLQKNNSGTQFGSYKATQTNVWLESAGAAPVLATLEGIVIKGEASKLEYFVGDSFDPAGLEVWGIYTKTVKNDSTSQITSGITWTIDPEVLAKEDISVDVTAQYKDFTSEPKTINVTVKEKPAAKYVPVAWNEIEDGGKYFITANNDGEYYFAAKAFAAKGALAIAFDASMAPEADMWTFTKSGDVWKISEAGGAGLYVTATNNGIVCAANKGADFTVAQGSSAEFTYLSASDGSDTRYISLYGKQDFRCYKSSSTSGSTSDLKLYGLKKEGVVAKPVFTPTASEFDTEVEVTLTAEEGADIYYTLDGTTPSDASTKYESAFKLTATTTVKAIAIKGGKSSDVAEKTYTLIPAFESLDALVESLPATDTKVKVKVTITDAVIDSFYVSGQNTNGVYVTVNGAALEIYKYNVPTTWIVGGKISGTIIAEWILYKGIPELQNFDSWDAFTYTAPQSTGINNVNAAKKATKAIVNGQIVIVRDNKTYNVLGF